jgi:mitotic spindle assembly checkpoint protein MAD2B
MSAGSLTQYFRSFLIKLCMIEAQLGQMNLGGETLPLSFNLSNGEQMKSHSLFFWSCGTLRHHLSLRARLVSNPV